MSLPSQAYYATMSDVKNLAGEHVPLNPPERPPGPPPGPPPGTAFEQRYGVHYGVSPVVFSQHTLPHLHSSGGGKSHPSAIPSFESGQAELTAAPNHPVHHRKPGLSNVFLYILAVFLPPVPVFLKAGCGAQVLINVLVSLLVAYRS